MFHRKKRGEIDRVYDGKNIFKTHIFRGSLHPVQGTCMKTIIKINYTNKQNVNNDKQKNKLL